MPKHPFDLRAGTQDFYKDPGYYDFEFKDRRADTRWYSRHYQETKGLVLELGVGTGRVALRAVRDGGRVLGLDLSQEMLERAARRREALPKFKRSALSLVRGDMRAFAFGRRFPLISCPFNAFQHLYERWEIEGCLRSVREALEPDGLFLFDVLMPDLDYLTRPAFKRFPGVRFKHPSYGIHYTYSERSAWDPVSQVNQMWFHYDRSDEKKSGPQELEVQLSHRVFFPAELENLLHYNGFKLLARFGDFEEGALRPDAESMVLICGLR